MKNIKFGIIHFLSHLIVETITFYILTKYFEIEKSAILCLLYDLLAFVPQGIYGYILDNKIKIPMYGIGIIFLIISTILSQLNSNVILIIILLSIGNALIHVFAAQITIRTSLGKMSNVSLFVGGGSFGLLIGKLLPKSQTSNIIIYILIFIMCLIEIFNIKNKDQLTNSSNLKKYNYTNKKINSKTIIILSTLVVAVRALIGYGIPTAWNKEVYQLILLFVFMGLGKILGGILIDTIGIKKVIILSSLVSIPFLIFGENIMIVSIIGVMLFSMTMSITLALILSRLNKYPGVGFGFTTLGLFIGTLPIFFIRFSNVVNIILITTFSILSFIILMNISKGEEYGK